MNKDSQIIVGKVSGCFGVRGWLKIFSYCDPRENIITYKNWNVGDSLFSDVEAKKHGKLILAKLKGINDKDTAQTLIGSIISIEKDQLIELNTGEHYWHDLMGLEVSNKKGIQFGKITSLLETGVHDVIVVTGDRERLIPYITDESNKTIIDVDLTTKTMTVDWHEDD